MKRTSMLKLVLAVATVSVGFGVGVSVAMAHNVECAGAACTPSDRGVTPTLGDKNVKCSEVGDNYVEVSFDINDIQAGGATKTYTITGTPTLTGNVIMTTSGGHASIQVTGGAVAQRIHLHGGGINASNMYIYSSFPAGGVTSDGSLHWPGPKSNINVCLIRPTALAVTMQTMRATRYGKAVVLRWRTASEIDTLGFNAYKQVRGKRVKLNQRLIPAASLRSSSTLTHSYSFRARFGSTRAAAAGRFWLQEVELDGKRNWYGPLRAVSAT